MADPPTLLDEAMAIIMSYHPKCDVWSDDCHQAPTPSYGKRYHKPIRNILALQRPARPSGSSIGTVGTAWQY
jgi:hypothetical protein